MDIPLKNYKLPIQFSKEKRHFFILLLMLPIRHYFCPLYYILQNFAIFFLKNKICTTIHPLKFSSVRYCKTQYFKALNLLFFTLKRIKKIHSKTPFDCKTCAWSFTSRVLFCSFLHVFTSYCKWLYFFATFCYLLHFFE